MQKRMAAWLGVMLAAAWILAGCGSGQAVKVTIQRGEADVQGTFSGTLIERLPEGEGSFTIDMPETDEHGFRLEGTWAAGVLLGSCKIYDADGALVYDGACKANLPDGDGKEYAGGVLVYAGGFAAGKREGTGRLYGADGVVVYEGTFHAGEQVAQPTPTPKTTSTPAPTSTKKPSATKKPNATSKKPPQNNTQKPNVSQVVGDNQEPDVSLNGTFTFEENGVKVTCTMVNGTASGPAKVWMYGELVFDGTLRNNNPVSGTLYIDGSKLYSGGLNANCQPHGQGTIFFEDGTPMFEGTFRNDIPVRGTRYYIDGKYVGSVDSDYEPHGQGTGYFDDGEVWQGQWEHGYFIEPAASAVPEPTAAPNPTI